jgi:WD40 repeat protein
MRAVRITLLCLMLISSTASAEPVPEDVYYILDLAWSPDGDRIAVVGVTDKETPSTRINGSKYYGYLSMVDVATGAEIYISQPESSFSSVAWSPDGKRLTLGSYDGSVWVIDAADGHQLATLSGHTSTVTGVDWNSTGTQIVSSGNWDEQVILWDAESLTMIKQIETTGFPNDVAFSADDQTIILGADNGLFLIDPVLRQPGKVTEQPPALRTWVFRLALGPDGRFVAVGSYASSSFLTGIRDDGHTFVVDVATGNVLHDFVSSWGSIAGLSWSPDNQYLAVLHEDNLMTLWDLKQETPQIVETHPVSTGERYKKSGVGFSPYGGRLAIISESVTRSGMPGVQIIVPAPSIERLNQIAESCATGSLRLDTLAGLDAFRAQVEALAADAIPSACRADLLAIVDALGE